MAPFKNWTTDWLIGVGCERLIQPASRSALRSIVFCHTLYHAPHHPGPLRSHALAPSQHYQSHNLHRRFASATVCTLCYVTKCIIHVRRWVSRRKQMQETLQLSIGRPPKCVDVFDAICLSGKRNISATQIPSHLSTAVYPKCLTNYLEPLLILKTFN